MTIPGESNHETESSPLNWRNRYKPLFKPMIAVGAVGSLATGMLLSPIGDSLLGRNKDALSADCRSNLNQQQASIIEQLRSTGSIKALVVSADTNAPVSPSSLIEDKRVPVVHVSKTKNGQEYTKATNPIALDCNDDGKADRYIAIDPTKLAGTDPGSALIETDAPGTSLTEFSGFPIINKRLTLHLPEHSDYGSLVGSDGNWYAQYR